MIKPTDEMIENVGRVLRGERPIGMEVRRQIRNALTAALAIVERSAVTEYGAAYKSGDVQVWADDDEYPVVRRIVNHQRMGGAVITRRVIVLDEWTEVPQ